MPDEILRMRATVQSDEALAQIRQLGRAFGLLPTQAKPHVDTLTMSFTRLGTAIRQVGGEMRTAVPALGGIGLGAAGAGAALYALGRTFSNVADRVVELKYRSKELGMSERELRAWSFAAERVGVSGDAMLQGLQNFKTMTDGLKYNLGGVRDHLYSIGAGPVVQQMQAATSQAEKLKVAFAFKDALNKEDPTGFKARQAFIELGLGAEAARLSLEEYNEAQGHIKERTPAQVAAAKAYRDQLLLLKETWDDFITKQGITLFPALESELVTLGKVLDYLNSIKSWRDAWDNLPKELFDFKLGDPSRGIRELQELEQKRGGFKSEGDNPLLAVPGGGTMGGYSPISYSDGFRGGGGAGLSEGSRMVKDGVFAALVDFQSYVQAGAGTTSADGFQKASFGGFGSGGGAPGGGGGGPPVTGGGGGPMGMGGTSGGGGTQGGSGPDAQPGGGTPSSGPGQIPGTGSVPHEVMAEAKNLLQRGASTGQLQQFMASKGYPKAGAWCGEFAASVVKSAGGTPPKGAATASNWLGWGQHVDPKDVQEGDIAVRTRSRFGGRVIPGRTGGHVGLVGKVGEKTFERIGGNQGKPSVDTSRYSGEYEFRRGVPSDSPDGRKTATGPSGAGGSAKDRDETGTGDKLTADKMGRVDPSALNARLQQLIKGSKLEGFLPQDAAKYGFKTGSAAEWAGLMSGIAGWESGNKTTSVGDKDSFAGGSQGLFQLSRADGNALIGRPFTDAELRDPDFNARMAVKIAEKKARVGGVAGKGGMADYWAGHGKRSSFLAQGRVQAGVDTGRVDAANKPNITAKGEVNVNVHAPPGTKTDADSDGMFQKTIINRHRQMQPTETVAT